MQPHCLQNMVKRRMIILPYSSYVAFGQCKRIINCMYISNMTLSAVHIAYIVLTHSYGSIKYIDQSQHKAQKENNYNHIAYIKLTISFKPYCHYNRKHSRRQKQHWYVILNFFHTPQINKTY